MLAKYFFKSSENQQKAQDILEFYQKKYNRSDDQFTKYVMYELWCHLNKYLSSDIQEKLQQEFDQPSLLFENSVFSEIKKKLEEEIQFLENPTIVEDGVVECKKCKSLKTVSFAKQTRASDEGTSVFVTCVMCKYKFKL